MPKAARSGKPASQQRLVRRFYTDMETMLAARLHAAELAAVRARAETAQVQGKLKKLQRLYDLEQDR